jgi:hypothetical protein
VVEIRTGDAGGTADGQHTIVVTEADTAGAVSAPTTLTFTLDTVAPVAPASLADASISNGYVNAANDTAAQKLTGSAEAGSTVTVYDGTTQLGTTTAGSDGSWRPRFAAAYSLATSCYPHAKGEGWISGTANEIAEVTRLAQRAVELGNVRKGEHGSLVAYADKIIRTEADAVTGKEAERAIPFMKGYTVFNVEQIDGAALLRQARATVGHDAADRPGGSVFRGHRRRYPARRHDGPL